MPPANDASDAVLIPNVPFYAMPENDPGHCYQVAMRVVLEYFLHKPFSLDELDRLTGRKDDFWTWGAQVVSALDRLGLNVKYYSSVDIAPFLEGESFIRRAYPNVAEKAIQKTDMPVMIGATHHALEKKLFEVKKCSMADLEAHLRKGHLIIVNLDMYVLYHLKGNYGGHSLVLVGFDADHVYLHESNFARNAAYKKVPKADFEAARAAEGIDFDVIIVEGKRAT